MYTAPKNIYRERVDFAKIHTSIPIPNLIEIQKNSYERFLQMRVLAADREDAGLQSVFKSVFPITDLRENCSLEFVEYSIGNWECKCGRLVGLDKLGRPCTFCGSTIITDPRGDQEIHCSKCDHLNENTPQKCDTCDEPVGLKLKYDVDECQERGMTFAVPLKVTIRLVVWDKDPETAAKSIRDIKEQEVYFGDIPLMTENGTFIINGTERVIVSQLHRSPGVFFSQPEKGLFAAQIIPYRGSWVEFEYDSKNLLHVRIDRKRKFLATVFLRAMGMKNDGEILKQFYKWDRINVREGKLFWKVSENLVGLKLSKSVFGAKDGSGKRRDRPRRQEDQPPGLRAAREVGGRGGRDHRGRPRGRLHRRRHRRPAQRRGHHRGQRGAVAPRALGHHGPRGADPGLRGVLHRARRHRPDAQRHGQEGHDQDAGRVADRDLSLIHI